jgi:hypothetical protein
VHGGWVNSSCKPLSVIRDIILSLTSKGQTVFDFFSGGQVLKAALLLDRECIAFASSAKELLFLSTYANYLRQHPTIKKFWKRVERINKGEKVPLEDGSEEGKQQLMGVQEEDPENQAGAIVVHRCNSQAPADTLDAMVALGLIPSAEEEAMEEALEEALVGSSVVSPQAAAVPATTAATVGESINPTLPPVSPASPHQAGAYYPSSPDLSTYSSLSQNINTFVQKPYTNTIGSLAPKEELVFSHYEWKVGHKKGQRLDYITAKKLLRKPDFQKDHLDQIWVLDKAPAHSDSVELQNILGNTKVSEYGSFVNSESS